MNVIMVLSGKGGVGKTTVAVALARKLADKGYRIGLLDADIHGPDVFTLFDVEDRKVEVRDGKLQPVHVTDKIRVISFAGMVDEDKAVIWRGPLKIKALNQLVNGTDWGDIDYLIVDLPPGTGDEPLTIAQLFNNNPDYRVGALLVTIPHRLSLADLKRAINFCSTLNIPIIGVVENMRGEVFDSHEVERYCESVNIPVISSLPMDPAVAKSGPAETVVSDSYKNGLDRLTAVVTDWFNR